MLGKSAKYRYDFPVDIVGLCAWPEKINPGADTSPQPSEENAGEYFKIIFSEMLSCNRSGNSGLMVDQQVNLAVTGTEKRMGIVGPNNDATTFDRGLIDPQSKLPLPVKNYLQGMVPVSGIAVEAAQIQKMTPPKINAAFGHVFFHNPSFLRRLKQSLE
jgi:hypothetical protein